jgi:hypothetical protein
VCFYLFLETQNQEVKKGCKAKPHRGNKAVQRVRRRIILQHIRNWERLEKTLPEWLYRWRYRSRPRSVSALFLWWYFLAFFSLLESLLIDLQLYIHRKLCQQSEDILGKGQITLFHLNLSIIFQYSLKPLIVTIYPSMRQNCMSVSHSF